MVRIPYFLCRNIRHLSHKSQNVGKSNPPNPSKISSDMIGPVDPTSNLRPITFREKLGETSLEKLYREKRIEIQNWNQMFWSKHNSNFFKEKEEYIKKNSISDEQPLTADEMSVFYKAFLDKNWNTHVEYNKMWYQKNIHLLMLTIKVKLQRLVAGHYK